MAGSPKGLLAASATVAGAAWREDRAASAESCVRGLLPGGARAFTKRSSPETLQPPPVGAFRGGRMGVASRAETLFRSSLISPNLVFFFPHQTLKESCNSTEDPEADGCGSDRNSVMTSSSSPSLRPRVERGAGTAASRAEQRGEQGKANDFCLYIYIDPRGRHRDSYSRYSHRRCLWALPAHAWSLLPPSGSVSPSPPSVAVSAALP